MYLSSQAASLRIEAHQLPALRAAFTEAVKLIQDELTRLRNDGFIPESWLGDEVSIETHNYYTQQVMGPVGTPFAALVAYQDELERVRDTLQAMEDHYRRTEGENTAQWKDIVWVRLGKLDRSHRTSPSLRSSATVMSVRRGWLLLVGVALLLAGCSAGGPEIVESPPSPTSAAAAPRPRDLSLDGVDPCSLLTPQQRAEIGLDQPPRRVSGTTQIYGPGNSLCVISGFEPRSISVGILVVTTVGIERWHRGETRLDVQPSRIEGYPVLLVKSSEFTDFCRVVIDVGPGQLIDVQFSSGALTPIPQMELCRGAERVASHVLNNLLSV